MFPRELTTGRLRLRSPLLADAPAMFAAWASDPEVTRHLTWEPHATVDTTLGYLRGVIAQNEHAVGFTFLIEAKEDATLIGSIEGRPINEGSVGFGYVLAREHWGNGYASESLRALIDIALSHDPVYRAQAFCYLDNHASARVMEKAGMSFEGILRRYSRRCGHTAPEDVRMYARCK